MRNIIILIFFCAEAIAQHGVGSDWGTETAIPKFDPLKTQRGVLFNNMAVSTTGRIFVLTTESNPLNGIISGNYLYYSDDGGSTWTSPLLFTPAQLVIGASPMKLAMGSDNILHIFWSAKNPSALYYSRYDQNLNLLADTIRVGSRVLYNEFAAHLTTDANNRLHAIWHEGSTSSPNTTEVYYSRSTNGGTNWSAVQRLSSNDGRHSAFPRAQFDAAQGDTLAIAWRDSINTGQQWDIYMSVTTNGGVNWSAPFPAVTGNSLDSDPDIIIDAQNRIHLAYHQYPFGNPFNGANIRYSFSDNLGASWHNGTFSQISQTGMRSHLIEGNRYDPVRNILWMVWKDERDFSGGNAKADIVISYSTNRGASWSIPEFATDRDSMSVGFKAGSLLPGGELALNYEVTTPANLLQVYFRKRSSPVRDKNAFVKLLIEGRYDSLANSMVRDTITMLLRSPAAPYNITDSAVCLSDSLGNCRFTFEGLGGSGPYFAVFKHRNSVETWSAVTHTFVNDSLILDMTSSSSAAYGGNMKQVDASPLRFAVYSGDVNKDGFIDAADLQRIDNDVFNFASGKNLPTDLDGDTIADGDDYAIADNNALGFIGLIRP